MKKIAAFHLYNDFSGSPKALKTVLEGLLDKGCQVDLITSEGGVLDELTGHQRLCRSTCGYSFSENHFKTAIRFAWAQVKLFFMALRYVSDKNVVFYINTIMPVGAALAGRLTGKQIVYHYHENAYARGRMYSLLASMMEKLADRIICVSDFQRSLMIRQESVHVVPNALAPSFVARLNSDPDRAFGIRTVLMISSLKLYKGIPEFIDLASRNLHFRFRLVLSDIPENISEFLVKEGLVIPQNMECYSRQTDVTSFYNEASVLLNLSRKDMVVETFGLTVLEAMTAGLPVIVPTVGGISELVEDGVNGYRADAEHLDKISALINNMLSDRHLYVHLSLGALQTSKIFSAAMTVDKIEDILFSNS